METASCCQLHQDHGQLHKHFTDKDGQLFTDKAKVLLAAATYGCGDAVAYVCMFVLLCMSLRFSKPVCAVLNVAEKQTDVDKENSWCTDTFSSDTSRSLCMNPFVVPNAECIDLFIFCLHSISGHPNQKEQEKKKSYSCSFFHVLINCM